MDFKRTDALRVQILEFCCDNAEFEEAHRALLEALMILIAISSPSEQAAVTLIGADAQAMQDQARQAYRQVRADLDSPPTH
jgi:hypothetical protein